MAKITALALKHKYPEWNIITVQGYDDEDRIVNFDVPNVENPPEESEWPAIQKEYEDYLKSIQYQRDRAEQYPSIQEQLDMQYWDAVNGTKKWQEAVAKVKTDNPKPE